MTETNDLYEAMARRRGHWKVEGKVEVWRSGKQGAEGRERRARDMERKLAEARREDAEWEQWVNE